MSVPGLRKVLTFTEVLQAEKGRTVSPEITTVAVAAVFQNPWVGEEFVEDLSAGIGGIAPELAKVLVPRVMDVLGGADNVEAFGKAAVAGLDGEVEHAAAFIHTLQFGNRFREAVNGTSYLSFTNRRTPAGAPISIPMTHKNDGASRDHYLTFDVVVPDAPAGDELLVAIAACSGGRPFPRIGNRNLDRERNLV